MRSDWPGKGHPASLGQEPYQGCQANYGLCSDNGNLLYKLQQPGPFCAATGAGASPQLGQAKNQGGKASSSRSLVDTSISHHYHCQCVSNNFQGRLQTNEAYGQHMRQRRRQVWIFAKTFNFLSRCDQACPRGKVHCCDVLLGTPGYTREAKPHNR